MGDQTKDLQQQQQQQQLQQQQLQQQQLQQQQLQQQQLGPTISMQEYQNVSIPSSQQVSHNTNEDSKKKRRIYTGIYSSVL
jgi:hypothetical protein